MIGAVGQAGRQKITWMVRAFKSLSGKKNVREKGAGKISGTGMICLGAGVAFYIFEYTQKIGATQAEMGGRKIFRITGIYSGVQLLMLIFGISIVEIIRISGFEQDAAKWYHALVTAVLLIYAFSCVRMAFCGKGMEEHLEQEPGTGRLISQSARAGIKTTIISMLAWYASSRNFGETITIWLLAVAAAVAGLLYGYWYGSKWSRQICFAGGGFLLIFGMLMAATPYV